MRDFVVGDRVEVQALRGGGRHMIAITGTVAVIKKSRIGVDLRNGIRIWRPRARLKKV